MRAWHVRIRMRALSAGSPNGKSMKTGAGRAIWRNGRREWRGDEHAGGGKAGAGRASWRNGRREWRDHEREGGEIVVRGRNRDYLRDVTGGVLPAKLCAGDRRRGSRAGAGRSGVFDAEGASSTILGRRRYRRIGRGSGLRQR